MYNHIRYNIYESGELPTDFRKRIVVIVRKKKGAEKQKIATSIRRTISLISHTSKIMTRIIYRRIKRRIEEELGEEQFGFRKIRGTRKAILSLRLIIEERLR